MSGRQAERRSWPDWLEPLRPDDLTRARMRRAILARAARLLGSESVLVAEGPASWQDVAAGWSRMLLPIAAVLLLFFAGLAYQAGTGPERVAVADDFGFSLEELARQSDPQGSLELLTATDEPTADRVLTAVIDYRGPQP